MEAAATPPLMETGVVDLSKRAEVDDATRARNLRTPPASDSSSHGHKEDDVVSSSELSDLDEEMEEEPIFEDRPAHAAIPEEILPDRYEGGIPIFTPV